MDVHHLRYFLAVVDHGSVSGAAAGLGVTQPTISQAIRTLEADLGALLFHRIGRGMVPTSAGEALVGSARRVLRGISSARGVLPGPDGTCGDDSTYGCCRRSAPAPCRHSSPSSTNVTPRWP